MRLATMTVALGIGASSLGLGTRTAQASVIGFDFRGTLSDAVEIDGVSAGDAFTGSVRFDPAAFQRLVPEPGPDGEVSVHGASYAGPVSLEVTVRGQTFRVEGGKSGGYVIDHEPHLSWGDEVSLLTRDLASPTAGWLLLSFVDPTGTALRGAAFPTIVPADFSQVSITLSRENPYRTFSGAIDSVTAATVPEPSALWLLGLVAIGAAARRGWPGSAAVRGQARS